MSRVDDVEAINNFMNAQHPVTPEAKNILSLYKTWYQNSSFWDKHMDDEWFDQQRSRRNQFNLANAVSPAAKAQVEKVLTEGITSEQQQGKARPKVDAKTGAVGTQVSNPTVPGIAPGLSRVLKLGVRGDDVKQWQSFLGLTPPTGYFDALTVTKTKDWQKARNLKVDGIVGKNSWTDAFGTHATVTTALPPPPVQTPAAKANTPKPAGTPAAETPAAPVAQAGMLPDLGLEKIPFWAKIAGALGIGGLAAYAAKKQYDTIHRT